MRFVDYREKLGIGVNDNQKFDMFKNKISILFSVLEQKSQIIGYETLFLSYFSEVGETPRSWRYTGTENVCHSIKHHDKTGLNVLEYVMYQTGNIIRLLITLKQAE